MTADLLALDLLAAHATREDLEGYDPTPDHARSCRGGAVGGTHLAACAYCQARLFAEATPHASLVGVLLAPALRRAARAAAGAVIWDEDALGATLAEPLRAWRGEAGAVGADGLAALMRRSEVSYGTQMAAPGAAPEVAWVVPLADGPARVALRAGDSDTWALALDAPADLWVEVQRPGAFPEWSGRAAEFPPAGLPLAAGRWELRLAGAGPPRVVPLVIDGEGD